MNKKIKSILNVTWKVGLGLIGVGVAVFCIILAIAYYEGNYGRYEWRDRTLSEDVVVRAYNDNTVRIWNKATKKYTTKRIRWVSGNPCEGDSLTVFCDKDGKRGYVNVKTGRIVIPAQYSKAWNFSEGLAAVLGRDNCIGFIDKDNQLVIDYVIPLVNGMDYIFRDGYCLVMRYIDGIDHYALYRKDGSLALDWSYTRIDESYGGYRVVGNEEGYWLVDDEFNKVFPDVYDRVVRSKENNGVYITKNHVKQLWAYDGTVIESFVVDSTFRLEYDVMDKDGDGYDKVMAEDILVYMVDGWEGLMDARTGRVITPACYWDIKMVSKDLLEAELGYGNEGVILDKTGRVIGRK